MFCLQNCSMLFSHNVKNQMDICLAAKVSGCFFVLLLLKKLLKFGAGFFSLNLHEYFFQTTN